MKIIVVDDHIAAQETVTAAVASDPATKHHAVTGVRTPDELHRLTDLGTFRLAFVDLDFRRQSRQTGLFALRLLHQAGVPAVIWDACVLSCSGASATCPPIVPSCPCQASMKSCLIVSP